MADIGGPSQAVSTVTGGVTALLASRNDVARGPAPWPEPLKRRLGLSVVSEKVEGRGRVYRIGGSSARETEVSFGSANAPMSMIDSAIAVMMPGSVIP